MMQIYETSFSYIFLSCANFVKKTTLPHTAYTLFRYICDTLNLIHSLYMFRLFLILSVFMISSCSNTQPHKKKTINYLSLHEQQNMGHK